MIPTSINTVSQKFWRACFLFFSARFMITCESQNPSRLVPSTEININFLSLFFGQKRDFDSPRHWNVKPTWLNHRQIKLNCFCTSFICYLFIELYVHITAVGTHLGILVNIFCMYIMYVLRVHIRVKCVNGNVCGVMVIAIGKQELEYTLLKRSNPRQGCLHFTSR